MVLGLKSRKKVHWYGNFSSLEGVEKHHDKDAVKPIRKLSGGGWGGENALRLGDPPIVLMQPSNTGMPTCPFFWYSKDSGNYFPRLDNMKDFTNYITNLNEILSKTTEVVIDSYQRGFPVAIPCNFGMKLTGKQFVRSQYKGEGEFVFIEGDFFKPEVKENPLEFSKSIANDYLDRFIGWNFGDIVRSNPDLENRLLELSRMLIDSGDRSQERAMGFEVTLRDGDSNTHYDFPKK
jgi:hypothetical protein